MIEICKSTLRNQLICTSVLFFWCGVSAAQELPLLRPISVVPYQLNELQERFLQWPDASDAYESIDGRQMQSLIIEQQQISRDYRDSVNSQYWGRIIGASSDWESAEWLAQKYRDLELSDVSIQPF